MKKNSKILSSNAFPSVFLVLSLLAAILFRASRSNWVFINKTVGIESFSVILLTLMALTAVLFGVLLVIRLYTKDEASFNAKKYYRVLLSIGAVLTGVLFVFAMIYSMGLALSESSEVFFLTLRKTLSEGATLIIVPCLALFFPKLSCKVKKVVLAVLIVATVLSGINAFSPLKPYKITSEPMVIDNGNEYSIVFSTNDYGTAYAEYTFEGKTYKVFDNTGGRLNSNSKIHSVAVPYEHLRNNTYTVGSTRVVEEFSYGSRRGKTVTSAEYNFTFNDSDKQTWLVISDWHTMLDDAYKAISNLAKDYDAVILLGDASPGVDFEEQVISNIVDFGGEVSGGTKPVLYVRGNHETRGSYANDLPVALGLERFYYTADIGPYSFVVLDSGEDKDDSHIEYGGMNDYNTYRADMIKWLKGIEAKNEKVIALSHCWEISGVEEELSLAGWAELDRLDTRLLLSGHEHVCRFLGTNEGKEKELKEKYPDIIGYIDGGKIEGGYIASLLTLDKNSFEIYAVDTQGNEIIKESFNW